ncbi:hypothetical protein [Nocardioides panaciterrulae]|uniref:Uncharacterized protein n=1 Tax=Nocardioides panaciterrulae TaxID=661492 RepID=A0A7Y9E3J2_9ACTN|nr:hypothetical protein [Nocardioides panaciterrulae]NYD40573.1 hypothetical protein [Nocardioides panaciterrulae]
MDPHTLTRLAGLVGGLCWLARLLLDLAGHGAGAAAGALYWTGSLLVAVALIGAGAALVSSSASWLRAIVGVAFPLLVWSVLGVLHNAGHPQTIDGVAGLLVAGTAAAGLARSRPDRNADRPGRGPADPGGPVDPSGPADPGGRPTPVHPGQRRADGRRTRSSRGAHAR